MDDQKQQIVERIEQANNILVTVSSNPSVDQLAACLGLTLMLNELGKHAAAVFSGEVPRAIEFLEPEKTIEKNTDSLRDFIIALDKAKADKLRYKVEDKVVKIFITPYKTSISQKDFEFSQGDFNVEVVVALGVHDQKDLDQAITAHGRILHDATVASINTTAGNNLGTLNWQNDKASSLSEMIASMADSFEKKVLDNQVATALLTGIVAETDRFSNNRTTPDTMKASAQLMAAGANQQLVATKLEEPAPPLPPPEPPAEPPKEDESPEGPKSPAEPPKPSDGTLQIDHDHDKESEFESKPAEKSGEESPAGKAEEKEESKSEAEEKLKPELDQPQINIDEQGRVQQISKEPREFLAGPGPADIPGVLPGAEDDEEKPSGAPRDDSRLVLSPPTIGGTLTANSRPEDLEPSVDPLSAKHADAPLLEHNADKTSSGPLAGAPASKAPAADNTTPLPAIEPDATTTIPDFTLPEPSLTPPAPVPAEPPADQSAVVPPISASPAPEPSAVGNPADDASHEDDQKTLTDLEKSVEKDHGKDSDVGSARDAVASAIDAAGGQGPAPSPIAALNAQPLGNPLHDDGPDDEKNDKSGKKGKSLSSSTQASDKLTEPLPADEHEQAPVADSPSDRPLDMPLPPSLTPPPASSTPSSSPGSNDPSAPPPVPPPMMPLISPTGQ